MERLHRSVRYLKIMTDRGTPWVAKLLFAAALIYLLVPADTFRTFCSASG